MNAFQNFSDVLISHFASITCFVRVQHTLYIAHCAQCTVNTVQYTMNTEQMSNKDDVNTIDDVVMAMIF